MELGVIGSGRMGTNTVRRLIRADFADKMLSALRYQFGGHKEKAAGKKAGA